MQIELLLYSLNLYDVTTVELDFIIHFVSIVRVSVNGRECNKLIQRMCRLDAWMSQILHFVIT